ncbi:MAG: M50 family metallopeptidase [Clostridia bacterium]|nr:M50 family metallopeptidase [Clostridia bacterium]
MNLKIDLKLFLFAIIFFFTHQIKMYALLMVFALLHELGHLICGLLLGFKPKTMAMNPWGFQIEFEVAIKEYHQKLGEGYYLNLKKIFIALAGPLTNFLIALICFLLPIQNSQAKEIIIYANFLIAIFNLLPIYPLDGGRILKELIQIKKGLQTAYKITNKTANVSMIALTVVASIAILYIHNIAILFILAYLWYLVARNNRWHQLKKRLYSLENNEMSINEIIKQ